MPAAAAVSAPRRHLRRGAAVAMATVLTALVPAVAAAEDTPAFTIRSSKITESSGLATDTAGNRYWTVNDSGDGAVAYALGPKGKLVGTLRFLAEPTDVEAVAMRDDRLYLADIGDNRANREFVTVYYFDDPQTGPTLQTYRAVDFAYPDGPQDAETLLVNGKGRLFLVTKGAKGGIYRAPKNPSRLAVNQLERVAKAPAYVTDGVFLPGADRIALRTYVSVIVIDADSYQTVAQVAAPFQPQGESITATLDGDGLLLGSEGKRSKVYRIDVPTDKASVPAASASPPPSPSPSSSPTPTTPTADGGEDTDEGDVEPSRQGTWLAVGLAALVAVLSGVVVVLVRKP